MELAEVASTLTWVEHLRYFLEQFLLFQVDFSSDPTFIIIFFVFIFIFFLLVIFLFFFIFAFSELKK